jgi:hypothetical protein
LTLAAQVVDHEGRPVPAFTFKIVYGALPERLYRFETMEVQDAEGRFAVPIGTDDPFPVAMAAPGYAPSARVVQVTPDAEPLVFTLDRGVAVDGVFEGTVRKPGGLDVLMELKEGRYGCELFDVRTRADERGAFRLEHVAPGKYVFLASGLGISPIVREVDVGTEDVHLGSLEYKGSGRISGVVHIFRSEPWRFASGTMWNEASGEEFWFRADARGRFEVDNVPVGTVQIVCMWGVTDLPSAATATVEVVEGQTSTAVVRFSRDD